MQKMFKLYLKNLGQKDGNLKFLIFEIFQFHNDEIPVVKSELPLPPNLQDTLRVTVVSLTVTAP